jgi:ABC-type lipoprotein export system ATPase subunit
MRLRIDNVHKSYSAARGEVRAVSGLSLSVDAGEFIAVQGPSGCGKTTLLMMAGGLLAPDAGHIRIDGCDPYELSAEQRARFRAQRLGFVFQQFHLVPYLSVLDNVLVPALAAGQSDARQRAMDLIERFGLGHRIDHVPARLSSGERQRTALARALLGRPKLVLADEPTGNLDRDNADAVLEYLGQYAAEGGAVLLVTHDRDAARFAHEVKQMSDARLVAVEAA